MRRVVERAEGVCHGMRDAETYVGICHCGDVLRQCHAFASVGISVHSLAQVLGDELDSFKIQAVGQFPGSFCGVALYSVSQRVHTGGSGKASGHRCHHVGIHDSDVGDVVGVNADEFADVLHVGNDIVYGGFRARAAGGGHCDSEHCAVLCRRNAFERADIRVLGVVDDDADRFSGIHRRAAAYCDHEVGAAGLVGFNSRLDVFNCGIGFDIGIELEVDTVLLQKVCDFGSHAEFYKIGV